MHTKTTKILIISAIFLSLLTLAGLKNALAIGQITQPIVIENALRGQAVTALLKLFNSQDQQVTYGLQAEGDIADWATFYKINDKDLANPISDIQVPPKSYLDATVKFSIPPDAPNGEYQGEVVVFTAPSQVEQSEQSLAAVGQQIGRQVVITVTDKEVVALEASIIPLSYDVKLGEPLQIKIIYDNKSNIAIKPDVQIKITRDGSTIFNAIFPYAEGEPAIKTQTRKTMPLIEWSSAGQPEGKYRAELKIAVNGQVMEESGFNFYISSAQISLTNLGKFLRGFIAAIPFVSGGHALLGWSIIAGVVLIVAATLTFTSRRSFYSKGGNSKRSGKANGKRNGNGST